MGKSHPNQPYEQHHAVDAKSPVVSFSQIMAAGFASAGAAAATSRFGVAGTLVGAALTTMIITGGSAVLKSYLETIGTRIQRVPGKLRAGRNRQRAGRTAEQPAPDAPTEAVETRKSRREGFFGKLRSACEWFRNLPSSARRSILLKAAIPMVAAFVIAIVAVTGTELLGGRTLSCMVWGECYVATDGTSGPSTSFGTLASGSDAVRQTQPVDGTPDGAQPLVPDGSEQPVEPAVPGQPDDSAVPEQPVAPEEVAPEEVAPEEVAPEEVAPEEAAPEEVAPEEAAPVVPDQ